MKTRSRRGFCISKYCKKVEKSPFLFTSGFSTVKTKNKFLNTKKIGQGISKDYIIQRVWNFFQNLFPNNSVWKLKINSSIWKIPNFHIEFQSWPSTILKNAWCRCKCFLLTYLQWPECIKSRWSLQMTCNTYFFEYFFFQYFSHLYFTCVWKYSNPKLHYSLHCAYSSNCFDSICVFHCMYCCKWSISC